jgi:hypothetical protein
MPAILADQVEADSTYPLTERESDNMRLVRQAIVDKLRFAGKHDDRWYSVVLPVDCEVLPVTPLRFTERNIWGCSEIAFTARLDAYLPMSRTPLGLRNVAQFEVEWEVLS